MLLMALSLYAAAVVFVSMREFFEVIKASSSRHRCCKFQHLQFIALSVRIIILINSFTFPMKYFKNAVVCVLGNGIGLLLICFAWYPWMKTKGSQVLAFNVILFNPTREVHVR